jgi:hypothetical protein
MQKMKHFLIICSEWENGQWLVAVTFSSLGTKIGYSVTTPPQDPLGSEESLDANWTTGVNAGRTYSHFGS